MSLPPRPCPSFFPTRHDIPPQASWPCLTKGPRDPHAHTRLMTISASGMCAQAHGPPPRSPLRRGPVHPLRASPTCRHPGSSKTQLRCPVLGEDILPPVNPPAPTEPGLLLSPPTPGRPPFSPTPAPGEPSRQGQSCASAGAQRRAELNLLVLAAPESFLHLPGPPIFHAQSHRRGVGGT